MERVFAARVIQLGVYHRALGGKEGVGEITVEREGHLLTSEFWFRIITQKKKKSQNSHLCIFLGERLNGTDTNVHISHPLLMMNEQGG